MVAVVAVESAAHGQEVAEQDAILVPDLGVLTGEVVHQRCVDACHRASLDRDTREE